MPNRERPLRPFRFQGERPTPTPPLLLAILEAAAARRRAHALTVKQQRDRARADQAQSGLYVRIDRPILNHDAFIPQMEAWYLQQTAGNAKRRQLGTSKKTKSLEMTILDTRTQTLGAIDPDLTEEDLRDRLQRRHPELFEPTGRVAYDALALFGDTAIRPWVALPISRESRSVYQQRQCIREIVAPNTRISTDHIRDDRLHTSLGDITVGDSSQVQEIFTTLSRGITPRLPAYGQYGPIRITVAPIPKQN